jgi:hypothetical protein
VYRNMAKKKNNDKPKSKMLPSKIPSTIHQQDYSTLISEPKAADFASISKEVNEYEKVLKGEASTKALTILPPFGRIYFEDTGETCVGPDGKKYPQHTLVDAHVPKLGLLESADRDFKNVSTLLMPMTATEIRANRCVPVTIKTIDSGGKAGKDTKYISVIEENNMSPNIKMLSKKNKEGMILMNIDTDAQLDAGQQLFVGSVTILGLYMFYRLLYKKY